MPDYFEADRVAQIAANSDAPMAQEFGEAALRVGEPALATGPAPKKDFWHTYSVRLSRFLDGEGPKCEGLEQFVEALDSPGSAQMIKVKEPHKTWLALLEPGERISAITTVAKTETANAEVISIIVNQFFQRHIVSAIKINAGWIGKPGDQEYTLKSITVIKDRLILEINDDIIMLTHPKSLYTQDEGEGGPLLQIYDFDYGLLDRDKLPPGQRVSGIPRGVVEFYGEEK